MKKNAPDSGGVEENGQPENNFKKEKFNILLVGILVFLIIGGIILCNSHDQPYQDTCYSNCAPAEIVAVKPHHATRVCVIYRCVHNKIKNISIHQSNLFTVGNITINPHDYLSFYGGTKPYGPISGGGVR